MIREKLLEYLPQEVPYNVQQVQAHWGVMGLSIRHTPGADSWVPKRAWVGACLTSHDVSLCRRR